MRKLLLAATILAALQTTSTAYARAPVPNPDIGTDLFAYCTSADLQWQSMCMGYIRGAFRIWVGVHSLCPASGSEPITGQVVDTVKKGLSEHPEERQSDSGLLILKYLSANYPCLKTLSKESPH